MKISILIGTALATTILILMSFTSIVSAQSTKYEIDIWEPGNIIQWLLTLFKYWEPGAFIYAMIFLILILIYAP